MQVRREAARTGGQWNSTADDQKLFTVEEWQACLLYTSLIYY